MTYVGIDITKLNHFAPAISSDGEILMEPFQFSNDTDGFQLLASALESVVLENDSLIIGLGSTAHYGDNLVRYLVASYFKVCVLNPIQTSTTRKNNIRRTKTDKVDTHIIVKTLIIQDSYRFITFYDLHLMAWSLPSKDHKAADTVENPAVFLCGSNISGTTVLL